MKKIKTLILSWRYRRLYRQLFMLYANKTDYGLDADYAGAQAAVAFEWITGIEYPKFLIHK